MFRGLSPATTARKANSTETRKIRKNRRRARFFTVRVSAWTRAPCHVREGVVRAHVEMRYAAVPVVAPRALLSSFASSLSLSLTGLRPTLSLGYAQLSHCALPVSSRIQCIFDMFPSLTEAIGIALCGTFFAGLIVVLLVWCLAPQEDRSRFLRQILSRIPPPPPYVRPEHKGPPVSQQQGSTPNTGVLRYRRLSDTRAETTSTSSGAMMTATPTSLANSDVATAAAAAAVERPLPLFFAYGTERWDIQDVLRPLMPADVKPTDVWIIYTRDWLRDHTDITSWPADDIYESWHDATRAQLGPSNDLAAVRGRSIVVQPFEERNEEIQYRAYASGTASEHPVLSSVRLCARIDVASSVRRITGISSILDTGAPTCRLLCSLGELGMSFEDTTGFSHVTCAGTRFLCWRTLLLVSINGASDSFPTPVYVPLLGTELRSNELRMLVSRTHYSDRKNVARHTVLQERFVRQWPPDVEWPLLQVADDDEPIVGLSFLCNFRFTVWSVDKRMSAESFRWALDVVEEGDGGGGAGVGGSAAAVAFAAASSVK